MYVGIEECSDMQGHVVPVSSGDKLKTGHIVNGLNNHQHLVFRPVPHLRYEQVKVSAMWIS